MNNCSVDVSVIIVNYNTSNITCACLESIYDNTKKTRVEVIVVDNNSVDESLNEITLNFPQVKLIKNKKNVGFGIANNQGMDIAKGKYFLLINSDTYLINNSIDIAFEYAEIREGEAHVFGADIRNPDLTEQRSFYAKDIISIKNTLKHAIVYESPILSKYFKKIPESSNREIGGLYGAYIFLNRNVYENVGGFDPDFFMYCEETEWFRNRINKKYKIEICDSAKIVHIGGGSSGKSVVPPLNILSYYLYWYKLGYIHYSIYLIGSFFNTPITLMLLPFMSKTERKRHWNIIYCRLKILPKLLFNIPLYKNKYGARSNALRL